MRETSSKVTLSGVPETMLQTVYARAKETQTRGAVRDEKAVEIIRRLDYDFSLADKDSAMSSGVIARTIVLDRLVGEYLAAVSRRDCHESRLRARYPLLPDAGLRPLV